MIEFVHILFFLVVLIYSVIIHEVAHGFAALRLGDETAKMLGRLTFNPIKHIDLFGSILFPLLSIVAKFPIILGWAKPVPYNPNNLHRDYKYGPLKVALAGPLSNLFVALTIGLFARIGVGVLNPLAVGLLGFIVYLNIILAIFNLLPIPPLDGSKIFSLLLPGRSFFFVERVGFEGILLIFLFLFLFGDALFALISRAFLLIAGESVFLLTVPVLQAI